MKSRYARRRGGVLVMFALAMVVIIACSGLAIDVGRMYVTRTEAQSFVDALALAKAAEYLGAYQVNANDVWKLHNFNNASFDGMYDVSYSSTFGGTYSGTAPESGPAYVRVTATVDVPLLLLKVLLPEDMATVSATAVAAVEQLTSMSEGGFPLGVREPEGGPGGFTVGTPYTLRWDSSAAENLLGAYQHVNKTIPGATLEQRLEATATILGGGNPFGVPLPKTLDIDDYERWCAGDATADFLQHLATSAGFSFPDPPANLVLPANLFDWDGLYYKVGSSFIKAALAFGYQEFLLTVGGSITYAPGKEGEAIPKDLWDVIKLDSDQNTQLWVTPKPTYAGNGYRLIVVPVVAPGTYGNEQNGTAQVTGLEAFVLQVQGDYAWDEYDKKGNWCATYFGAMELGTGAPVNQPSGIWKLRLVS